MIQKNEHHTFVGMQRDTTISKHPSKYLYDAHNIRLTQREGSTLLAITNEKGTDETGITISGIYLGHCLLNKYLTVFSTVENHDSGEPKDFIERIDLETLHNDCLYAGDLNFKIAHPIEAIGSYENEKIQKVYWTDGENPPRVINIAITTQPQDDPSFFDFINDLHLNEKVKVQKILGANGMFAPGVIQYAFTYYHKYGQESNIFYTTPLLYVSNKDRGNSPEDTIVENAFKIVVENVDTRFDYLRIYSIQRTSVDGTPICKRIQDVSLEGITGDTVSYTDTGTSGDVIDPTELLYKGGETIKAGTIEQKDGTLFLGDIEIERQQVQLEETDVNDIADTIASSVRHFMPTQISTGDYAYSNQLTSWESVADTIDYTKSVPCAGFKCGDYYRLGVQFQYKTGKWSDPIFIADVKETEIPREGGSNTPYPGQIAVPTFTAYIPADVVGHIDLDYKRVRPVVVYPTLKDRVTICQGVANPTMYTNNHRNANKDLYAQASWFFRPYSKSHGEHEGYPDGHVAGDGTVYPRSNAGELKYKSNDINDSPDDIRLTEIQGDFNNGTRFQIDRNFWTLNSPEIELDDSYKLIDYSTFKNNNCRQVGYAVFKKTLSDIDIQTSSPAVSSAGSGFIHKSFSGNSAYGIVSGLFYDDFLVDEDAEGKMLRSYPEQRSSAKWLVYLWNKDGSLNNDINRPANLGTATAVLKKKIISNLRYSDTEIWTASSSSTVQPGAISISPTEGIDPLTWLTFPDADHQGTSDPVYVLVADVELSQIDRILIDGAVFGGLQLQLHKNFFLGAIKLENPAEGATTIRYAFVFNEYIEFEYIRGCSSYYMSKNQSYMYLGMRVDNNHLYYYIDNDSDFVFKCVGKDGVETYVGYTITFGPSQSQTTEDTNSWPIADLHLFDSDQLEVLKVKSEEITSSGIIKGADKIYMGNIDTILTPDSVDGMYFAFNNEIDGQGRPKWWIDRQAGRSTPFESNVLWKTFSIQTGEDSVTTNPGLWFWNGGAEPLPQWQRDNKEADGKIGEKYTDLVLKKEGVRMKYKSTPHLVFRRRIAEKTPAHPENPYLPILEITRDENSEFKSTLFGGTSEDALRECVWIPCGEPVTLNRAPNTPTPFEYSWGDTYYQRWDCLKTYPFTREDVNQVVEIGSFMLETHVNIDGRYDRNRGQLSNLYMSPVNFNLLNPVYGQLNNFFTYKILDDSFYKLNRFPNQITWTKEKKAGADVDLWTNITLASTYDMDGSKGKVVSLNTWKDQIFCFQDKGISNILFNSRVQIPTSDGVPIEISNGYKVDGYRYITDGIGCVNKWTIKETPSGVYFIDSVSNNLFKIGENSADVSSSCNMQSWFKENNIARTVYDDVNKDLYVIPEYIVPGNIPDALCFSEILGQFSSFMSYGGISLIESYKTNVFTLKDNTLYKMFAGDYNEFFGQYKPWDITFVSNGLDNSDMDFDKIFTNIDYRLDFFDSEYDPDTTFDYVRAWNEYQDTREVNLSSKSDGKGIKTSKFYAGGNPQKKFRIWRIQIPRAKRLVNNEWKGTNDRIRNPWCTITLGKRNNSAIQDDNKLRAVLQDLNIQYYL